MMRAPPRIARSYTRAPEDGVKIHPLLQMQQTVGNQAVQRLIKHEASAGLEEPVKSREAEGRGRSSEQSVILQKKLAMNLPGDACEQEADRMAEKALSAPAHTVATGAQFSIQRLAGSSKGEKAPASMDRLLAGPGRPLEPDLREEMEAHFGYDLSQVRVHTGAAAEQSARDVNAIAYTAGSNIVFGVGRFAPSTPEGRRLLAHELTHVIQQSKAVSNHSSRENKRQALHSEFLAVQRKVDCNLDHIDKECAGAASSCITAKSYCEKKYPAKEDIDKLHANAIKGANEYKSKYPNAADNLLHFLNGSGKEKVMNVDLFRNHPATLQKHGEHLAIFKEGARKRFASGQLKIGGPAVEMVWTDTANAFSSDFNDLGLAVGGYTLCSKVSAKALDPKEVGGSKDYLWLRFDPWSIQAFDCYNWDPGKGIGLPFATDNDLCCLENAGRAKHYRIRTDPWKLSFPPETVRISEEKPPAKPSTPPPPKPKDGDR